MLQILHGNEKEQFRKLFNRDRIDRFEERFAIVNIFLQTEQHVTSSELLLFLNKQNIKVESKLVTDTLRLMCRYGFARKHQFKNGDMRYEHLHLGQHHDHMICLKCNKIFEFKNKELEKLQLQIACSREFHVLQHRMELYGICSRCMIQHDDNIACISDASSGERLVVSGFIGGKKALLRLLSVGLRIGDEVEIISNSGRGQLVIALGYKRLVLCREFANKILVNIEINNKLDNS